MSLDRLDSPWCYPLHLDSLRSVGFVELDQHAFHREPFHDRRLDGRVRRLGNASITALDDAGWLRAGDAAPRYVFHHGFSLSTLLSRLLERSHQTLCYREPSALTDLAAAYLADSSVVEHGRARKALDACVSLLSRTGSKTAVPVIKACDCVTPMAETLLTMSPRSTAVLLHTDLESFALACLKSERRRHWLRYRLDAMRTWTESCTPAEAPPEPRDDGEAAAMLWWTQMSCFADLSERFPDRVRVFNGEHLLGDPIQSIARVRTLLALPGEHDRDDRDQAAWTTTTRRHAKTGEFYVPDDRRREQSELRKRYATELLAARAWLDGIGGVERRGEWLAHRATTTA